jgi:hypothetical protein
MSALGLMVGAWSMLVQVLAPQATVSDSGAAGEAQGVYTATVSAYSCDAHPANRMHPCGPFRDGTRPSPALHGLVAACPLEWLGRTVTVEGWGALRCRDTPRTGWYGDSPHIDVFTSYPAALEWGIQERRAWTR